jgi:hypothetical protein
VKGEQLSFAGTIVMVSGDNLGSHLCGGFKDGAGAHMKCWNCMGNQTGKFVLRSRDLGCAISDEMRVWMRKFWKCSEETHTFEINGVYLRF